jgi:transcription-repair coupling factor (superfamily II helicase)
LEVDTHIPGTYVHSAAEREKVMNDAEKAAKESMRALMVFTNHLRSDYGKEPPTIEMLLKTMYVKRIAADLGIHRIRTRGKTVVMETNMELEAFDMLASAVSSDTLRASLSYERGRIEVCSLTLAQAFCVSFYCTPIVQCMSSFSHMKSILQKQKISCTLTG